MKSGSRQSRYNFNPTDFCCISTGREKISKKKKNKIKKYLEGLPKRGECRESESESEARCQQKLKQNQAELQVGCDPKSGQQQYR